MSSQTSSAACLRSLRFRGRYTTGRSDLVADFFRPCLDASQRYDRAAGFFSSGLYLLVGLEMAAFAKRGGIMRLVCCPRLSENDLEAIRDGYLARTAGNSLIRELEDVLNDPVAHAAGRLLATLIFHRNLELRIAFRPRHMGIYHDKVGIFVDKQGDKVSFDGSANESWSAWAERGNFEAFHAFTSWDDPDRASLDVEYFESLWSGHEPGLEVIPFPEVAQERLEALVDSEGIDHAQERLTTAIHQQEAAPQKPKLFRHQQRVLEDWRAQQHRGIVEHATGSGKTITALSAAAEALDTGHAILVVVPSIVLLDQWRREVASFFGSSVSVMTAGGGNNEWRSGATVRNVLEPGARRLVLATLDTAATQDFTSRLEDLHPLTLIVDEVHRTGSPERRNLLDSIDADWRLGLSATWEREGDAAGTAAILDYFERVLQPVYSLADAVNDGRLSPYRYVVHPLSLTGEEMERWKRETVAVGRALGQSGGEVSESVRQLLIRRARIIKNAAGKPEVAADVLRESYRDGDAWLVYCDDTDQLRTTRSAIEARGLQCMEYHRQAIGDEEESLREFERTGGIMLAIKCLDEGVDIPRIDHALILASSTTRREFIQRRGRVLRKADRKFQATIHDVLVDADGFDDPSSATFLRNEVARAQEFAQSARDSAGARLLLDRWERRLIDLGLQRASTDTVSAPSGVEEDDEDV